VSNLAELHLVDPPEAWSGLGFEVAGDAIPLRGVTIRLAGERALAFEGVPAGDLDGVKTVAATGSESRQNATVSHPNGAVAVDHFVLVTPDFDRTQIALGGHGLALKRIRDAGGFRQGFRRVGPAILELVEAQQMPAGPARLWGVTLIAEDLGALAAQLGPLLRPIKDAVQPGRRIATVDRSAGLRTNVAFMDSDGASSGPLP
jgi:hypothetical protein